MLPEEAKQFVRIGVDVLKCQEHPPIASERLLGLHCGCAYPQKRRKMCKAEHLGEGLRFHIAGSLQTT